MQEQIADPESFLDIEGHGTSGKSAEIQDVRNACQMF